MHHQTVQHCVERALAYGALAALDDRPRPGKEPTITPASTPGTPAPSGDPLKLALDRSARRWSLEHAPMRLAIVQAYVGPSS